MNGSRIRSQEILMLTMGRMVLQSGDAEVVVDVDGGGDDDVQFDDDVQVDVDVDVDVGPETQ
jgi:hypothetical protein